MKSRFLFVSTLCLALLFSSGAVFAEKFESPEKGFSIEPPDDWVRIPQNNFQGGVVSYTRKGATALFHVTERDMDEPKSVSDLKWEDLFSPQFGSIVIKTQGETTIGGENAKYCVYTIKPGPFKTQMEGPIPAKYINYVIPRGKSLFSVTFVDTFENFSLDYSSFLAAVRTIRFSEPKPIIAEGGQELFSLKKISEQANALSQGEKAADPFSRKTEEKT